MNHTQPVSERLVTAARELFTRKGFEETSVREITTRAEANLGAITYHFGSKEALFHAAIESVVEPLVTAVASAAERDGSALDRIDQIVRAFLAHVERNPWAPALLLRELSSDRPIPPPIRHGMQRNLGLLVRTITAGQEEGSIRTGDPLLLALSVVAQPFFFTVAARLLREAFGLDRSDRTVYTQATEHIAIGVRRYLAAHVEREP
jgi:AcrR family transcriptional regulator